MLFSTLRGLQELPGILKGSGLLAPLLQGHVLAIPVCPKAPIQAGWEAV